MAEHDPIALARGRRAATSWFDAINGTGADVEGGAVDSAKSFALEQWQAQVALQSGLPIPKIAGEDNG